MYCTLIHIVSYYLPFYFELRDDFGLMVPFASMSLDYWETKLPLKARLQATFYLNKMVLFCILSDIKRHYTAVRGAETWGWGIYPPNKLTASFQ